MTSCRADRGSRLIRLALAAGCLLALATGCTQDDSEAAAHAALVHKAAYKDWLDEAGYEAGVAAYEAKDYGSALADWLEVANRGDAEAEMRVAALYEDGLGVAQDYVEAHRWYNLAAAAGAPGAAEARDALAAKMSKEQLAEAQRLAAAWKPATAPRSEAAAGAAPPPPSEDAVVHFKAGLAALKDGRAAAAVEELTAGLAISPDAEADFFLGEAYRLEHESELALKAYDESLARDPASAMAARARSGGAAAASDLAAKAAGETAEAARLLKLLGYDPGPPAAKPSAKLSAALSAFEKKEHLTVDGKLTPAIMAALKKAAEARAHEAAARAFAGAEALKAGRLETAVKELRASVALKDDAAAEYLLGEAYRRSGERDAALLRYKKSLALDDKSAVADKALQAARDLAALEKPSPREAAPPAEPAPAPAAAAAVEPVAQPAPQAAAAPEKQPPAAPETGAAADAAAIQARIEDVRRRATAAAARARQAQAKAYDAQPRARDAAARARNGGGAGLFAGAPANSPGQRYEGGIDANMRYSGYGIYYFNNGDRMEGQFSADEGAVCYRIYYWSDGAHYEGEFRQDAGSIRDGYGVYTTADGHHYEGQWSRERMSGYMVSTAPNGEQYEGEFRDNLANGRGILLDPGGKLVKSGIWRDGKLEAPFEAAAAK